MGRLEGKVALVTGGSSGIGFATAKRLVAEGAFVFLTGRRESELRAATQELGPCARGVVGDVSKMADLDRTGTANEIAHAALFLASDESSYMAGSELFVDGGLAQV